MTQKHDILKNTVLRQRSSIVKLINYGLSLAAGGMVGILMFLVVVDVIGRYLFNKPVFGAFEVIEVLMGWLIFAGLPLVSRANQHITVDFISDLFPVHWKPFQGIITNLLCAVTSIVISWRIWLYGDRMNRVHETTLELNIPRGLVAQAMSVMIAITALAFFMNVWDYYKLSNSTSEKE